MRGCSGLLMRKWIGGLGSFYPEPGAFLLLEGSSRSGEASSWDKGGEAIRCSSSTAHVIMRSECYTDVMHDSEPTPCRYRSDLLAVLESAGYNPVASLHKGKRWAVVKHRTLFETYPCFGMHSIP